MSSTIIQQGRFTSDGTTETIQIRSDIDWMEVYNTTVADDDTQTTAIGVQYYWQRGFDDDTGLEYKKSDAANAAQLTTLVSSGGFTLVDSSDQAPGTLNSTITVISGGSPPIVTTSAPHALSANDVVRLINITGGQQLGGIDFTIGNNTLTGTTFSLDYMAVIVAATTGSFRLISFDPIFAPPKRTISSITQASSAVIQLTVTHTYTVGQAIRVKVPAIYGMTEMDGLIGNITAISTANNTITVDINSSSFTAFTFPVTADIPFDMAEINPVGESATGSTASLLDDATDNIAFIGMKLAAGVDSPAGSTNDVIFWRAGKSFSVNN